MREFDITLVIPLTMRGICRAISTVKQRILINVQSQKRHVHIQSRMRKNLRSNLNYECVGA